MKSFSEYKEESIKNISDNDPIYVFANTPMERPGGILLTLKDADTQILVEIPRTFIPIDLTEFAPANLFKKSSSFLSMLYNKTLYLISVKEGKEIMALADSKVERERLRSALISQREDYTPVDIKEEIESKVVNTRILDIMLRSDIDNSERLRLLKIEGSSSTLSKEDIDYVRSSTEDSTILSFISDVATKLF